MVAVCALLNGWDCGYNTVKESSSQRHRGEICFHSFRPPPAKAMDVRCGSAQPGRPDAEESGQASWAEAACEQARLVGWGRTAPPGESCRARGLLKHGEGMVSEVWRIHCSWAVKAAPCERHVQPCCFHVSAPARGLWVGRGSVG